MRPFDVITFDCYGTLIDWETGIAEAFHDKAAPDGVNLDPAAVLQALFDTSPRLRHRSIGAIAKSSPTRRRVSASASDGG
jgi:FMN phosphatase YigB (HAD superfamily)